MDVGSACWIVGVPWKIDETEDDITLNLHAIGTSARLLSQLVLRWSQSGGSRARDANRQVLRLHHPFHLKNVGMLAGGGANSATANDLQRCKR